MSRKIAAIPTDYADWLADIKARVATARQRAALAANAELIQLYWQIGRDILERQQSAQWGDKVLDRLSSDLREAFPDMKGFSSRNLKYMKYFAEHCPLQAFGQQPAAQLPWFHIVTLLTKLPTAGAPNGMPEEPSQRAGRASRWSSKSATACTSGKDRPSPILMRACLHRIRNWRMKP